jgi:hypothetical protein
VKRALLAAALSLSTLALAGTKFVGGGLEVGPTAPIFLPFAAPSHTVHVSQLRYTQAELGFSANTRIIDVAWRKEGLGPTTGAGGCAEQVWLKNVARQHAPFTVGSTQALTDALRDAQKVIDVPSRQLPDTMGFVTLDQVENQFSFLYLGDELEVTIVSDCRAASSPVVDARVTWRYDVVPERVRVASGDGTDALLLTAEPTLSSFRPHTRFRTLVDQPGCEIRVGPNVLPNGGAFAVAPNHFAAGLVAPFGFTAVNGSTTPVTITGLTFTNLANGTATTPLTFPLTVAPGEAVPTPVEFTPTTAGTLSRLTVTWLTSAGNLTNTFQGTPTAVPMPNPAASLERPDGTTQPLMTGTPATVALGTVVAGHVAELTVFASNYGQTELDARAEAVSGDVTVVSAPARVGPQRDVRLLTRVRAPNTPGPFTAEVRVVVGALTYLVRESGVVAAPDLKVTQGPTEVLSGSMELVTRSSRDAFMREYRVENVGSLPLFFSERLNWSPFAGTVTQVFGPGVLAPGSSQVVAFPFPELAPTLEPFTFRAVSNDPDYLFTWTATTRLAGRGVLAVSVLELNPLEQTPPRPVAPGEALSDLLARGLETTIANVGEAPVTITSLGERCRGCAQRGEPPGPVTLQPGEALVRAVDFEVDGWRLEYAVESDADGSPLTFVLEGDRRRGNSCSSAGASGAVLLAVLALRRRRRTGQ